MPTITIRRSTTQDAAAYVRIMGDLEVLPNLMQLPYTSDEIWRQRLTDNNAPGKTDLHLVAELDGVVVGALTWFVRPGLFHGGPWGYIDELIVTARSQGRGIGDALISEVMRRFQAAGCKEAAVVTVLGNDRAAALYRKHGMVDEALQLERHFDE